MPTEEKVSVMGIFQYIETKYIRNFLYLLTNMFHPFVILRLQIQQQTY